MDDLTQRFATFDRVPVPKLWPEITRRATAPSAAVSGATVAWGPRDSRQPMNLLRLAVLAALLVAALVASAFVAGALLHQARVEPTFPAVVGTELSCPEWQVAARQSGVTWPTGSRPETSPTSGWIAAWSSNGVQSLLFIHPSTGEVCEVVQFAEHDSPATEGQSEVGSREWIPARGQIAWSPNGNAVAFSVVDTQRSMEDLFVLSPAGLVGPVARGESGESLDRPMWAPDGSWVAVTASSHTVEPSSQAGVLVSNADGGRSRINICQEAFPSLNGGPGRPCWGDTSYPSPDGDRLAVHIRGTTHTQISETRDAVTAWDQIAIVNLGRGAVEQSFEAGTLVSVGELVGWASSSDLMVTRRGFAPVGIPIDNPSDRITYTEDEVRDLPGLPGVSPDRELLVRLDDSDDNVGQLFVATFSTNQEQLIAHLDSPWGPVWWAPDSSLIGYLIDVQTSDQGIWTIHPDGTEQRFLAPGSWVLPDGATNVWQPRWSSN